MIDTIDWPEDNVLTHQAGNIWAFWNCVVGNDADMLLVIIFIGKDELGSIDLLQTR